MSRRYDEVTRRGLPYLVAERDGPRRGLCYAAP